jgi:transcriptional regulator with XRE-family HTH domain
MAQTNRSRLANEISSFRVAMNWTQDELARELNVTAATVSRWEAGISIPKPEHLQRIADISRARKAAGRTAATFLSRYQNIREQEQLARSLDQAAGILETHNVGGHTVALLEDGTLLVNDRVRISH